MIRECREDVLLGMTRFWSLASRVVGRSLVLGREECIFSDGPMVKHYGNFELVFEEVSRKVQQREDIKLSCQLRDLEEAEKFCDNVVWGVSKEC